MCHTLFHILATHICTCVQFLRNDDGDACAAEHPGSAQTSTPEITDEDSERVSATNRAEPWSKTNLAGTRSSSSRCTRGSGRSPGGAVWPVRQTMRMPSILLWPMWVARWRLALVVRHVVSLLRVGRIRGIGRTRCRYGWIYRYIAVRLYVRCVMMVILMSIL